MALPDPQERPGQNEATGLTGSEREGARQGAWSDSDIETLIEMWHMKYSNADIADVLERAENAVAIKASRLSLPPRRQLTGNSNAKIRKCLKCSSSFHSHGIGNRICDTCKGSSEWASGGDDYYRVMTGG
jgi:hypothetical protein